MIQGLTPDMVENEHGFYTFTGIYVGDTQASIYAETPSRLHLGRGPSVGNIASISLKSYVAGISFGEFRMTNTSGSFVAYLATDFVFDPSWFDGFSLGHYLHPVCSLDDRYGEPVFRSGVFLDEPSGDLTPNVGRYAFATLNRGALFAKDDGKAYYVSKAGVVHDLVGVDVRQNGVSVGDAEALDFVGQGVSVSLSGTVAEITIPRPLGASVRLSTDFSVTGSANIPIQWETEIRDDGGFFATGTITGNSRFTVPPGCDGWYSITVSVGWTGANYHVLNIRVNDTYYDAQCDSWLTNPRMNCALTTYLAAGDWVEAVVYTDTAQVIDYGYFGIAHLG